MAVTAPQAAIKGFDEVIVTVGGATNLIFQVPTDSQPVSEFLMVYLKVYCVPAVDVRPETVVIFELGLEITGEPGPLICSHRTVSPA